MLLGAVNGYRHAFVYEIVLKLLGERIRTFFRNYGVRLFTFVMGNSANEPLLEMLAKDSGGFAMNISSNDDITKQT